MTRHHERPTRRKNPSGNVVWVARYTGRDGKRRSAGTYDLRGPCKYESEDGSCCAQHAINHAYDQPIVKATRNTVGSYAKEWTEKHPRATRTNRSYNHRVGRVLDVKIENRAFKDWPINEIRRRHVNHLVDHLLRVQGRAQKGAVGILRVLSAMWMDALDDELVEFNPFLGVKVKASDPRISKPARQPQVWSWEDMHRFAKTAGTVKRKEGWNDWRPIYAEPMIRVLSDCGLRLGELLALYRADLEGDVLHVRRTAWQGKLLDGTKTDHGEAAAGRVVPVPGELGALLAGLPPRIDTRLLFPTPRGRVWQESLFYREVWRPAQAASGLLILPHSMRHSFVSHLRAAGVDPADLAEVSGHTVMTATSHYTHALGASFEAIRGAVG